MAIENEKNNYKGVYQGMDSKNVPRTANIISSHDFFEVKNTTESGNLKLKCRLVPHGNRDRDKESIRKDSSTAQFPVIPLLLSIAVILGLTIVSLDIKKAYLQAEKLSHDRPI